MVDQQKEAQKTASIQFDKDLDNIDKYMHIKGGATVEALKIFFPKNYVEQQYERLLMIDDAEDKVMIQKLKKKRLGKCATLNRDKMEHFYPGTGLEINGKRRKRNYT